MAADIDRQALAELQEKLSTTQAFHGFLTGSHQRATVELRRTELTLEELGALPDDVVTYKPVGKA
jgi:chaperonin cofactor prefoldin